MDKGAPKAANETSVLYEISLSIGSSLDLTKMLKTALSKMLRGLNCNAAVVFSIESNADSITWSKAIALPKTAFNKTSNEAFVNELHLPQNQSDWQNFSQASLPHLIELESGDSVYPFYLDGFGLLLLKKAGEEFSINLYASLCKMMPKLAYACLSCLHEQTLREQKQKAESANEAKSNFLASMSHEIRTPMNGVLGMLNLVLEGELSRKQRDNLKLAHLSANNLLHIINSILDVSRIEAGKFEVSYHTTDLFELVGMSIRSLAQSAWSKQLDLRYSIAPDVPRFVKTDELRLRQALVNLLGNAIKFTHEGHVFLSLQKTKNSQGQDILEFEVEDTGIGIKRDKLNAVFNPFEQADSGTNRQYEGTGLGLAITKQIIDALDGNIFAESEEAKGSTFTFDIPLHKVTDKDDLPSNPNISMDVYLVAEGNSTYVTTLETLLRSLGVSPTIISLQELFNLKKRFKNNDLPASVFILDHSDIKIERADKLIGKFLHSYSQAVLLKLHAGSECSAVELPQYVLTHSTLMSISELAQLIKESEACLSDSPNNETSPNTSLEPSTLALTCLVVDDNHINLAVAMSVLELSGFVIQTATNGQEALDATQEQQFDVVFMDVMMPVMDGLEATRKIREREQQNKQPHQTIVAMTANAMQGDREICLEAGMDGYIAKPIDIEVVKTELDKVFKQQNVKQ